MNAEAFRTLLLDVARASLGEELTAVEALVIGEEDPEDPGRYPAWLHTTFMQLMGTGVPQTLWRALFRKLRDEVHIPLCCELVLLMVVSRCLMPVLRFRSLWMRVGMEWLPLATCLHIATYDKHHLPL